MEDHRDLMAAAIDYDRAAHEQLFAGDPERARAAFAEAADRYRRSWEAAPPASYGRLVGMLKASVLAGTGSKQAAYVRRAIGDEVPDSATAAYALALAALIAGDDAQALAWSERMRGGSQAFDRTAVAIAALADGDVEMYREALAAIVRDFEERSEHLTGIAIADTALMLELLAARRGIAAGVESPVLPALAH